jgi:DNA-binding NtrC family response regulator
MEKILVIEDDESVRAVLRPFLRETGFEVTTAESGVAGIDILRAEKFDLILTDLKLPGGIDGMGVLREVTANKINIPVIVLTGYATVKTAVEAMKNGAFDYITDPFNSIADDHSQESVVCFQNQKCDVRCS